MHAITEGLRDEVAALSQHDGNTIRVCTIAPGVVETELRGSIRDDETRAGMNEYVKRIDAPLRREDIALAIMFVLSAPLHMDVNEVLVRPVGQLR